MLVIRLVLCLALLAPNQLLMCSRTHPVIHRVLREPPNRTRLRYRQERTRTAAYIHTSYVLK